MGNVKKVKKSKKVKEIKNNDDGVLEIVLGCLLFSISDFNEGGLFEKIVVLGGFLILMIGICRLLPKYKEQKKTVMFVLLGLMGIIALISFGGLLLRLFGIL